MRNSCSLHSWKNHHFFMIQHFNMLWRLLKTSSENKIPSQRGQIKVFKFYFFLCLLGIFFWEKYVLLLFEQKQHVKHIIMILLLLLFVSYLSREEELKKKVKQEKKR